MPPQTTQLQIQAYGDPDFTKKIGAAIIGDFNPTDYSLTQSNNYKPQETVGTSKPKSVYASGANDKLSLSFMFDGTGVNGPAGSVQERVDAFLTLLEYRGTEHEPPYAEVTWGKFRFQGVLKSATTEYLLFERDGSPLRAKIKASFEEVVSSRDRIAEESSSSPDVDRVWLVRSGDRIDRIAHHSYGNVAYWRQIARANRLANPRSLVAGSILSLPRLERT